MRHNPRGIQGKNFSHCHEYAYFMYPSDQKKYIGERKFDDPDVRNIRDSGLESDRTDAKNCFYPIIIDDESIIGIGEVPANGKTGNLLRTTRPTVFMMVSKFSPVFVGVKGNRRILFTPLDKFQLEYLDALDVSPSVFSKTNTMKGGASRAGCH